MERPRLESIGDILPELIARRGYAAVQTAEALEAAWREAAGEFLARQTRLGRNRGGTLEVITASSTLTQELLFQKPALLAKLAELAPDQPVRDLRFRVGPVQ